MWLLRRYVYNLLAKMGYGYNYTVESAIADTPNNRPPPYNALPLMHQLLFRRRSTLSAPEWRTPPNFEQRTSAAYRTTLSHIKAPQITTKLAGLVWAELRNSHAFSFASQRRGAYYVCCWLLPARATRTLPVVA